MEIVPQLFSTVLSATDNPFLSFTKDKTVMMLLYLTIALFSAVLIIGLLVKKFRKDYFRDFCKTAVGIGIGYSVAVLVFMLYLSFSSTELGFVDGEAFVPLLFYPILAVLLVAVAGGFAVWIATMFDRRAIRIIGIATALLELGAFIAMMVCMSKYYEIISSDSAYAAEMEFDFGFVNTTGLITSAVVISVLLGIFYALGSKHKDVSDTKAIVYGAISIAMSFALSYIRFLRLGQAGSVTLASLLPLMVYCCMFGTRRGIVACLIYGVLQAIQDPFIIHPMQFLLDYPLAFGTIGISGIYMEKGLFHKNKLVAFIVGAVLATSLRYACHVISGVYAFAYWANVDKYGSVAAYSLAYNSFVFVDMVITVVAGTMLFASKAFINQMEAVTASKSGVLDGDEDEIDGNREDCADDTRARVEDNQAGIGENPIAVNAEDIESERR